MNVDIMTKVIIKKSSPIEKANIFSYITFGYILKLLKKGWKHDLGEDDLYALPKKCKSMVYGKNAITQWSKTPSLFKLLFHKFGLAYVLFCIAHIVWTEIRSLLRPYGISRLIAFFNKGQTSISESEAYYCASIVIFTKFFNYIFMTNMSVLETKFVIQIRAALQSLLYEKILRLSTTSILETSSGNLITLMTKDIQSVESNLWIFKDFIIFTVQSFTVFYLIWSKVGVSAFVVVGIYCIALPLQGYLCSLIGKLKLAVGRHADERIQLTQEVLSAIRVIKMYTWENFFIGKITESRRKEVAALLKMLLIQFILIIIGLFVSGITFLILILTYIWLGNDTNTELIFYITSVFHELTMAMGIMIPLNMSRTAEFLASLKRINRVFQCQEISKIENIYKESSIDMNNATVEIMNTKVLDDVSLKISKPGLHVITGVVGSGKSSIFHAVIGLHNLKEGYCKTGGTISFAAQEPWLYPSSIKNNILFDDKYNKERYNEVLRICGLNYDLSYLQNGDETIVAESGINLSKGQQARINLARCVYKESDIYLLDDPLTALDGSVQDYIFSECICKFLGNKIVILISQNPKHIEVADNIFTLTNGKLTRSNIDNKANTNKDKIDEKISSEIVEKKILEKAALLETDTQYNNDNLFYESHQAGTVKLDVYKTYVKFGGGYLFFGAIMIVYICSQGTFFLTEKLFAKWVDVQGKSNNTNNTTSNSYKKQDYLNFYSMSLIGSSAVTFFSLYIILRFSRNASCNIHKAMISRVTTAVMQFFDTHYLGNVVNRFSYDLNIIDEKLPLIFLHLFRAVFSSIGIIVLIATVNWVFIGPSIIFMALVGLMRYFYINTGRNLKRIEAATRSPLVGHINSTMDGLSTIRAFDAEKKVSDEFYRHQDLYASAIFTAKITQAGFRFYMDTLSATFTTLIIAKYLFFREETTAGNVGLVLTNILRLSDTISWGLIEWIDLETNMTLVERCLEYANLSQESQTGNIVKNWPKGGGIAYKQVELRYGSDKIPVLKNINFELQPKHNIGIVGRTGAGKSSIISTLFRLYEFGGNVVIDGEDTKKLSLSFLRNNIAVIPQDPILFTGTIRENIDPYRKHSDEKIWSLLRKLMIDNSIKSLDTPVFNFSAGQKQLLCMARAALQNCKIVVLDEITANMDSKNDELIHALVKEVFHDCTILTIAHRLNFIMSCDMVNVMDKGEIVEFDKPKVLLEDNNSIFSKICGKASS